MIDRWSISCEIVLRWIALDLTANKTVLVQAMAWCRQATSHYLNQGWPILPSPYGVTRLQWVKHRWNILKAILRNQRHYRDAIMDTMASQITSLMVVYSTVYSGADQRKHHSSTSLAFERGLHRGPVNSPHRGSVTRKMFPFDDVIMEISLKPDIIYSIQTFVFDTLYSPYISSLWKDGLDF